MNFVEELAKMNLHLILRKIFENISDEDIAQCLKVSMVWREILCMVIHKDELTKLKWLYGFNTKEIVYRQYFTNRNIRSMLGSWNLATGAKRQSTFLIGDFIVFAVRNGFSADGTLLVFEGTTFKTTALVPNVMSLDCLSWWHMDIRLIDDDDSHAVLMAINDTGLHCWCYSLPDFEFKFKTSHVKLSKRQLDDIARLQSSRWFVGKSNTPTITINEVYLDVDKESFATRTHHFECLSSGFEFRPRNMQELGGDTILPVFAYGDMKTKLLCIGKKNMLLIDVTQDVVLVEVDCVRIIDINSIQPFEDTSNYSGFNTCTSYAGKFLHASINRNVIKIKIHNLDNGQQVQLDPKTMTDERPEPHATRFLNFTSSIVPKNCLLDDRYVAICCKVTEGRVNGRHGTRVICIS